MDITHASIAPGTTLRLGWPAFGAFEREGLQLLSPIRVNLWTARHGVFEFVVPPHEERPWRTDLASSPLHTWGEWDYAAVVHDFLYEVKGVLSPNLRLTRAEADKIFYLLCLGNGASEVKARAAWAAIRAAGWAWWRK